jgi:hypothetical protein
VERARQITAQPRSGSRAASVDSRMQPRPIVTATPYAIDDRGGVWLRPRRAAHSLKASLAAMAPAHGDAGSGRAGLRRRS